MRVLHLTNSMVSSRTIYDTLKEKNWTYVKHTAPPDFLELEVNYDLVIKDRYPFKLSNEFLEDNKVLSWIPSILPCATGRNTIIKSYLAGLPIGGTIFFLKSNDYLVDVLKKLEIDVDPEIDTLKTVYDRIVFQVMEELRNVLGPIIEDQNKKTLTSFEKIDPIITDEFLEKSDMSLFLLNGYDTRLVELNKICYEK